MVSQKNYLKKKSRVFTLYLIAFQADIILDFSLNLGNPIMDRVGPLGPTRSIISFQKTSTFAYC
jgi:hypothetical protein